MRAGPRGILITLADGIKLFFKEGITPTNADRGVYQLAPILAMFPGFLAFCDDPVRRAGARSSGACVPFQLADLNIGILWILAMTSIAVYGVVLAGWSSGSNYPLLGLGPLERADDQLRGGHEPRDRGRGHVQRPPPDVARSWRAAGRLVPASGTSSRMFPAFVVFLIGALAETNRPPFDLAEAESELVAGFHTEYSGIKFAMFYLGEYVNTVTVAAVAVTLFLGGWRGPGLPRRLAAGSGRSCGSC